VFLRALKGAEAKSKKFEEKRKFHQKIGNAGDGWRNMKLMQKSEIPAKNRKFIQKSSWLQLEPKQ
jgi:hypothetical protein